MRREGIPHHGQAGILSAATNGAEGKKGVRKVKIANDYKKIFLGDNAQIEGLIKITIEGLAADKVSVRVDLIDNDGNELIRFGPAEVDIGGNLTLEHVKMVSDIKIERPGF